MIKFVKYLTPPVVIILIGLTFSVIFKQLIGAMGWIPLVLVYWITILVVVYRDSRKIGKSIFNYFQLIKFKWYLFFIALIIGFITFPIFIWSYKSLNSSFLIISWIFIAVVNPFFEELFWRGFMLEKGKNISFWIKAVISSLLFTLSHPIMWSIYSKAMLTKELVISVFIVGLAWSFIYKKSKSLILPYFSHLLVDLFSCSVLAFMNLLPMI